MVQPPRAVSHRPQPRLGETRVTLRYYAIDLLWRPVGQLVRFVLVEHPSRGQVILMSSDLTLTPLELITCYGYRFKIEAAFKQALYTLGSYAYHFWMMAMPPLSRRSGNQYLHRKSEDYRQLVRRKLAAYHRYVQLGCIAQGLLQYLALSFRADVARVAPRRRHFMCPATDRAARQAAVRALPLPYPCLACRTV